MCWFPGKYDNLCVDCGNHADRLERRKEKILIDRVVSVCGVCATEETWDLAEAILRWEEDKNPLKNLCGC